MEPEVHIELSNRTFMEECMKILASVLSLTVFAMSSPAISKPAKKPTAQQTSSTTKPTTSDKKQAHCDQTAGNNHNTACY